LVEVTIEITQFCEEDCEVCSSSATPEGKPLPFEEIEKFLLLHKDIDRINISGGEPLSHPDIYRILKLCYTITENVWLYTNMIRNIIYNAEVLSRNRQTCPKIRVEANVLVLPGRKICIPDEVDKVHLLKYIRTGRYDDMMIRDVPISVSHNFFEECDHNCGKCENVLLQADGKVVPAPCKKDYGKRDK
jgi:hypothetical protein